MRRLRCSFVERSGRRDAGIGGLALVGEGQAVASHLDVGGEDDLLRAHAGELAEHLVARHAEADLECPAIVPRRRRARLVGWPGEG